MAGALSVGRKQWVPGPGGPGGLALTLSHQQPPFFQTEGVHPPGMRPGLVELNLAPRAGGSAQGGM